MSKEKVTTATEETTKETKKGLFYKIYGATKEALDARKMPLVIKALKRKFCEYVEGIENDIIAKEEKLMNMTNFETYNVSEAVTLRMDIEIAKKQQAFAKTLFVEMFDEEYKD